MQLTKADLLKAIGEAEAKYAIPRGLLAGLVQQESSFDPRAFKKERNGSVSVGLTQINSANFKRFGITSAEQLMDNPMLAIDIGARILREELNRYNNDPVMALIAYNGGAGLANNLLRTRGVGMKFTNDPRKYAANVLGKATKFGFTAPSLDYVKQAFSLVGGEQFVDVMSRAASLRPPKWLEEAQTPKPEPEVKDVIPLQDTTPKTPNLSDLLIASTGQMEESGPDTFDVPIAEPIAEAPPEPDTIEQFLAIANAAARPTEEERRARVATALGTMMKPKPQENFDDVPDALVSFIDETLDENQV